MMVQKGGTILLDINQKKIALVYREEDHGYTFPKGHLEKGETLENCAVRETEEETLRENKLLLNTPIDIIHYTNKEDGDVEVYYYLSQDLGPVKRKIAEKDREICEWFHYDEIRDKITFENLIEMWDKVKGTVYEFMKCNNNSEIEKLISTK